MFEFRIARRHIISKQRNTFFSILAVALAVVVIVVLMSLMTGFTDELIEKTVENSPHIVVYPAEDKDAGIHLYDYYKSVIESTPNVIASSAYLEKQAVITYRDNSAGINIFGVDPPDEDSVMHIKSDIVEGNYEELSRNGKGILIGDDLADDLETRPGEWLQITSPQAGEVSLKVIGIFDSGTGRDKSVAYARLETLQDFYDEKGTITAISMRLTDPYKAETTASEIEKETGLRADSWIEINSQLLELLNTQKVLVWLYYILIYITAGFGIANTLINIVMDKKSEIGMLMAMGTSRKSITKIFLIESTILGAFGLLLGLVLGYFTAVAIGSYEIELPAEMYLGLTRMPMKIEAMNFFYASIFAFIINMIAGVYPARKASKLDPVEAIESI
ncbi:ABC transporter permease [Methanohalophilus profundi]|uniref:ABC transporter permease n=1 Tax=Methanohalophilus profundi TaxID=2138083 RepID=UPI00101D71C3|nr:ABC transporter permease [Methanohalophilus profundi]